MDLAEARFLLAYSRWATARLLAAASELSPEAFTRDLRSSFPSVRDTLVHILWSEWIWLERCQGRSPRDMLDPATFPTAEAIRTRWRPVEEGFADLAADSGTELGRIVTYTNLKGIECSYAVGQILRHVVNHGTFHRGQLVTMLRQLGRVPPTTDLLVFVDEGSPGGA